MLKECPESYISPFSRSMLNLFRLCYTVIPAQRGPVLVLAGPLPSPGGVLDQDNAVMEAMAVIREEIMSLKPNAKSTK